MNTTTKMPRCAGARRPATTPLNSKEMALCSLESRPQSQGNWPASPRSLTCGLCEQRGVKVVEEQALYEGAAAPYPYLVERVGKMILDGVLGDVERLGDLLGGGALRDEAPAPPFPGAQPVCGRSEPRQFLGPRRFDDDHRLAPALRSWLGAR